MRHAGELLIQRPRHATCQRYFRSSGPVMRHASVTFDPAAPSCDMPALLLTQRLRHATCRRYFRSSGPVMRHAGASGTPAKFARYPASFAGVRRRPADWHATCRRGPFFILMFCARFHHVICATEILSDCEGKGLQVNDACQYVMLPVFLTPLTKLRRPTKRYEH